MPALMILPWLNRRTGGLEMTGSQKQQAEELNRRTGGLEITSNHATGGNSLNRRTGGLER